MQCPYCNDPSNRVIDSRLTREGQEIRRRRECDECGRRFTTRERVEELVPKIIKRDERREEFSRAKLEHSIQKAVVKRPISEDAIQNMIDRIETRLAETGDSEVPTRRVGELALEELSAVDAIAASRFASVFHDWKSPADYEAFFATLAARDEDESR
ncbi:MAG: transcriptional repressor NrdR [Deltaproteobacteria bacterium]|nr:transcriptional repressor NrdR [Deltaproteobacteria bacterium]